MHMESWIRRGGIAACIALAAGAMALPGRAQPSRAAGAQETSPEAVRACLCLQQSVDRQRAELATRTQDYDQKRKQAADLDAEVKAQKPQVNINDPASVAAFSRLVGQRDSAVESLNDELSPKYRAFIAAYNERVGQYNGQCSGRAFEAAMIQQVRQSLACPRE